MHYFKVQTNQYVSTEVEHKMEQEELSDSEDEVTEEVEFECEEMTDTEGEETDDCEHIDSRGIKVVPACNLCF